MIAFEKEVITFLGLPSIPKKLWDGHSFFDKGVAILDLVDGTEGYAVCRYDEDKGHKKPVITKVFGLVSFTGIKSIFVVPNYMSEVGDVESMDLDDVSKKRARVMLEEAKELEDKDVKVKDNVVSLDKLPEWVFDEIHNVDEAQAWLRNYNRHNGIRKGRIPSSSETLKLRLYAIYTEMNKKKK